MGTAMTDRADELARRVFENCTHGVSDYDAYGPCLPCVAAALRAYTEQARREELADCGRVLFGIADTFDALAVTQIGNEIVHGALTDKSYFVRNLATTLGCDAEEIAAIRARGEQG